MVWNVTHKIFAPDYRVVVVKSEELCDVIGPRIDGVEPLLAEYTGEVALDS